MMSKPQPRGPLVEVSAVLSRLTDDRQELPISLHTTIFDTGPEGPELEGLQTDRELKSASRKALSSTQARVAMEMVALVHSGPLVQALRTENLAEKREEEIPPSVEEEGATSHKDAP